MTELGLPPRIIVGANGAYWRDYDAHRSMCPVSTDNDPIEVVAVYVPEAEANRLAEQLENADSRLAELEETVDRLRAAPCPCGEYTMSGARISLAPKQTGVIVRLRSPEADR